jgi:hypothetical protein
LGVGFWLQCSKIIVISSSKEYKWQSVKVFFFLSRVKERGGSFKPCKKKKKQVPIHSFSLEVECFLKRRCFLFSLCVCVYKMLFYTKHVVSFKWNSVVLAFKVWIRFNSSISISIFNLPIYSITSLIEF